MDENDVSTTTYTSPDLTGAQLAELVGRLWAILKASGDIGRPAVRLRIRESVAGTTVVPMPPSMKEGA